MVDFNQDTVNLKMNIGWMGQIQKKSSIEMEKIKKINFKKRAY